MLAAPETAYRGEVIHESRLKDVLQSLDPSIHFDMGSAHDIWHPKINRWQGVFRKGVSIGAMSRGFLPEYNLYRQGEDGYGQPERRELLEVGWRTTVENIARRKIPWLTAQLICAALGQDYKKFVGEEHELNIPDQKVDAIHNTVG